MKARTRIALLSLPLALAACATGRSAEPIEVTRFVAPEARAQLGDARLMVETAPGSPEQGLALEPYKEAVARELATFGYIENARPSAEQIASVSVERTELDRNGRRSPVSGSIGGSTSTYGSSVGVGVGINLGGGSGRTVVTRMSVFLRDKTSGEVLWEGRARLVAPAKSPLAQSGPAAYALANALFTGFPGNSGETIEVEVNP
ncbi:DUF4136 domain-containing protein [Citromicrobium bathyomarinum]|uniref:DUF4136 domain-containing protein n=1 Tax=Citromicrobium bathyomarinum TaxID=72174 RepID=UPI00315A2DB6